MKGIEMMITQLVENGITRKIIIKLFKLLSIVNSFIPKNPHWLLFYDSGREYLDDNTEAFYTWLVKHGYEKKYKLICCVLRQKKEINPYEIKTVNVFKGILFYLTSKYVFFSFGDFRIKPSDEQIVVNLWHGTPLKTIGKYTSDERFDSEDANNFTYILAASDQYVEIMAKAFECKISNVKVLGHPRIDYFFQRTEVLKQLGIDKDRYRKLFLWMPTFRKSNDGRFCDTIGEISETMLPLVQSFDELRKINDFLNYNELLLVIKVHPYANIPDIKYSNIIILNNRNISEKKIRLYEFIKDFDALLTDYSSVFCDYLILDRPIGFILEDFEEYNNVRGFIFENIKEYMPGAQIYSINDMQAFFEDILNERDSFAEERRKMCNFFNKYKDGNNSKRLAETFGISMDN